jgi:serine-type D-Ala-D-Ala carboxypeptidase (penicillin-binding protein 5/6)
VSRASLSRAAALLAILISGFCCAAASAASAAGSPPEVPGAAAAIVVDARTGETMWAKDPRERRQIASTTKLMTALLTLERTRPREVFTAPEYDAAPAESRINLQAGERMSVHDLLEALLLESANDAAATLAQGISGSRAAFVAEMNARARELGLRDTSFANPIGLDDPDNYSSARDLATLATALMRNPRFARVVNMPEATLESGTHERVVANRNDLVARYPWVDGVKTGHTDAAGNLLVGAAHGTNGAKVISVVMGEPSEAARDADTLALLIWGVRQFKRVSALRRDQVLARPEIEYRDDQRAALVPRRALRLTLRDGQTLRRRVRAPDEVEGPIRKRGRVGAVIVLVDGKPVRRVALVTAADVPEAGTLRVITSVLGVPLTLLALLAILSVAGLAALRFRVRLRLVRR